MLCFILIQVNSSIIPDDQSSQVDEIDDNDESQHRRNIYHTLARQRLAPWKFPFQTFRDRLNRNPNDHDLFSTRREAFGRKHHWDAFFG